MTTAFTPEATIRWLTNPPEGVPRLTVGSESLAALPLSVDHDAAHPLATTPGELFAGAIGSVFAWFAAEELVKEGTQAHELIAHVTLTLSGASDDGMDAELSAIAYQLVGRIPGADRERVEAVARTAVTHCMAAMGVRAEGIAITVEASLEGA
jgi:organic hydroperoxide reductase OsmC/OhrA